MLTVIAPYIPPRLEGGILFGRGACDDKGSVVGIMAALKVISRLVSEKRLEVVKNIVAMFVIEEETGGNGSLSLAIDRRLKELYDSILVIECCDNRIHPANRGAVWYKAELSCAGLPLLEAAAFVIEEIEKEGRAIKAEKPSSAFPATARPDVPWHYRPVRPASQPDMRGSLFPSQSRTTILREHCKNS